MQKIHFATGNTGKFKSMQHYFDTSGIELELVQTPLNIVEIQADTVQEVARAKAKSAFEILGEPVIVDDSAASIHALNGYPGPYSEYVLRMLGNAGFLNQMRNVTDRSFSFLTAVGYADADGDVEVFYHPKSHTGRLLDEEYPHDHPDQWSVMWKIYVPNGWDKCLAAMSDDELKQYFAVGGENSYTLLIDHLRKQTERLAA